MKNNFNKEYFSRLLKRAIGSNTLREFSKNTGVSAGYLSRFTACSIENPPSPEVIKKISSKSEGRVVYRDLMEAAGYIEENKDNNQYYSNRYFLDKITKINSKIRHVIIEYLQENNETLLIKKIESFSYSPELLIELPNGNYDRWFVKTKAFDQEGPAVTKLYEDYGKAAYLDLKENDLFLLATNSSFYFHESKRNPPKSLRANYMIMLVDLEKEKIIQQEIICEYK